MNDADITTVWRDGSVLRTLAGHRREVNRPACFNLDPEPEPTPAPVEEILDLAAYFP